MNPKNLNKCCPSNDGNVGNAIACIIKIIKQLERGDSNIENNLDTEHFRALDAENTLQLHINQEYERATTKENELEEALNAEVERATTEEENINTLLSREIENRTQDVDAEELRASTAEEALNTKINFEITTERNRANTVESSLQTQLNQEVNARTTGLTAEEERATQAELDLFNKINSDVTAEKNRAEAAEGVLQDNIDAEETRAITAEGVLQDNIDNEASRATGAEDQLNSNLTKEITDRENADKAITDLIPSEATTTNQLADKDFVSQSVSTASATFRGNFNIISDLNLTTEATRNDISTALSTAIATADNNDYAFVEVPTSDDSSTEIFYVDRYKYNGTAWAFEYKVNNSGYTSTQWASINSGINSDLVTKLSDLPNNNTLQNSLNTLNLKDIVRVENITTNQSNVTSTITGAANTGRSELVIYKNASLNELTLTVSADYATSDGSQITLYIPANGYSEISYLNVGGTIYVRGA